jgi:hypothetical protein
MTLRTVSPADGSGAVSISWDYAQITVPAGSVVDIEPGSALEAAYGLANLTPLFGLVLGGDQAGDGGTGTDNN